MNACVAGSSWLMRFLRCYPTASALAPTIGLQMVQVMHPLGDPITGGLSGVPRAEHWGHCRTTEPGYHFATCLNNWHVPCVRRAAWSWHDSTSQTCSLHVRRYLCFAERPPRLLWVN